MLDASLVLLIVTDALFTVISPVPPSETLPPDAVMSFKLIVVESTLTGFLTFYFIVKTVSAAFTLESFCTVNIFEDAAYDGAFQLLLAVKFDDDIASNTFVS